ncbi:MAG: HTH domain-containing protein [Deltaproteobacteria bacterium]|nr:HTH domain-containing protein [Deltaproteobacteria bacterium]
MELLRQDSAINTEELGKAIGISKRAVLKQIGILNMEKGL